MDHANIVKLFEVYNDENQYYLVSYLPIMSLLHFLIYSNLHYIKSIKVEQVDLMKQWQ